VQLHLVCAHWAVVDVDSWRVAHTCPDACCWLSPACFTPPSPLQSYDVGSGVLPLPKQAVRRADQLYEQLDAACSGWLRAARALLEELSGWQDLLVTHVVVGHSQLVPLLAKLLLTRLDGCFGLTQVYSAAAVPKVAAFKRIRAKYGGRARYIVLGGGFEDEAAAELLSWPFVRITLSSKAAKGHGGEGRLAASPGAAPGQAAVRAGSAPPSSRPTAAAAAAGGRAASEGDGSGAVGKGDDAGGVDSRDGAAGADTAADELHDDGGGRPPDALGSSGHTIMDLTADKLRELALSLQ